jgi:predicted amidohydrolase
VRLAILELPARFDAFDAALKDARDLALAAPADLVLLPECALTGYVSPEGRADLSAFAEDETGPTLAALSELARDVGAHVAGPWVERDGARLYNAFVVLDPSGRRVAHYRKRHPWFPERWATPGALPMPELVIDGVRTTIAICYDLHFLEREAAEILDASDLLLFPSAWVDDGPVDLRRGLFEGLASRHSISIANANWGTGSPRVRGQGGSRFVTPDAPPRLLVGVSGRPGRLDVEVRHHT